jgi:hypothetical protein
MVRRLYVVALKCSRNHCIFETYKTVNHVSCISFKTIPLCNSTLLPAIVMVLETFLEVILWKPFQLLRRILHVSSITKAPPSLQCRFQSREHVKVGWSQLRRRWGISQFLLLFSLLRNPKPTGVLEHCREGETNCWVSILRAFISDVPKAMNDVNVHFCIHSNFYQS